MATFYVKGSDETIVLGPREALLRQFDFGTDWTEMRMGMFVSAIDASGPNNEVVSETLAVSGFSDLCLFGIKNSTQSLPGQAASNFIGVRTKSASVVAVTPSAGIGDPSGAFKGTAFVGVTQIDSATELGAGRWGQTAAAPGSNYAAFFGVQFIVNNIGTASQSVDVRCGGTIPAVSSTYTATELRTALNNFPFSGLSAMNVAWNTGAVARVIPDSFFVRSPLYLNRLRISAIRAIRYAP